MQVREEGLGDHLNLGESLGEGLRRVKVREEGLLTLS